MSCSHTTYHKVMADSIGRLFVATPLLERLNASGDLYLTHTVLDGKYTLRMSIGQTYTEARHVAAAWERIRGEARESEWDADERG